MSITIDDAGQIMKLTYGDYDIVRSGENWVLNWLDEQIALGTTVEAMKIEILLDVLAAGHRD